MTSKLKYYQDKSNKISELYWKEIEKLALDCFENVIKPYCIKHKLDFYSGNGTYTMCKTENRPNWNSYYEIPVWIDNILSIDLENNANSLGTIMPNFIYPE